MMGPKDRRSMITFCPVVGLLLLIALQTAPALASDTEHASGTHTSEPRPPELLRLNVLETSQSGDVAVVEAVLSPRIDAEAELEVLDSGELRFEGKGRRVVHSLRRGDPVVRERIRVSSQARKLGKLRVRMRLLEPGGRPWLVATHELPLEKGPPRSAVPSGQRTPVVHTLPDGSRIVEYMSEAEAASRGQRSEGTKSLAPGRSATLESPALDTGIDAGKDAAEPIRAD